MPTRINGIMFGNLRNITYPFFSGYQIEKFSTRGKFNDHEYVGWRINEFIMLDYMWVIKHAEYFDFSFDLFKYSLLLNFLLVKNLNCNLVTCHLVLSH